MNRSPATKADDCPLVTFALFAYNQEAHIREAVEGAFAQTYSPLEVILSDDASTDRTFDIMREMAAAYDGPHNIILNRNQSNLGIAGHVNELAEIATGQLVVLAAGDDVSLPVRAEALLRHWQASNCPPSVIYSDFEGIDRESRFMVCVTESLNKAECDINSIARGDIHALGATTAVAKEVFSAFSPIDLSVTHEDRVLPFRALLLGGTVTFLDQKLVKYRLEGGLSRKTVTSGRAYIEAYRKSLERTLPDARQRLSDVIAFRPEETELRGQCSATLHFQQACLDLIAPGSHGLESRFLKSITTVSRPSHLLKLYIKLRFIRIFDYYFRASHWYRRRRRAGPRYT